MISKKAAMSMRLIFAPMREWCVGGDSQALVNLSDGSRWRECENSKVGEIA